ncbi:NAD-dependent malic enzyme [Paenibacillus apiarius]|uniref:NAD-dependent malic enzyme n=1 Tax=Paenibacillus apiarius TaxID=46240 RepID=A0ABT4DXM0_9BACL|nr:NAD-dependent malic enzyme [Paenibacillus apiarius]MCY9512857.1 NAD-dependent malic enzyme [Paenibacillus apiarius]MCY9522094.1 NAD-dependent malic enzyme [Paenibacillus apiarius]MCY9554087.1 NAD-dependent malic enzyme [Paenibacillus apiarius]MCY9558854.1 NAD-dependent malic enzyme [Paenibacillus apiarius]MCY9683900.1 NAD-dependent malic enzyme [Paenibacillus apiarius]
MAKSLGSSTNIIIRMEIDKSQCSFAQVAAAIGEGGGDIVAIDVIRGTATSTVRDITVNVYDGSVGDRIVQLLKQVEGVKIVNVSDQTFLLHLGGKIEMQPKVPIRNRDDLSRVYTPGVARVCMAIHEDPSRAYTLTIKRDTVAVVSDGTAVLGLGDIGAMAAMPVMEGKAMLFKQFANVDAFPICLDTQDTEEIIRTIQAIAPAFGGINLEDISAPRCFEIEQRLNELIDIPVFHDDQHGTAVVLLAGILNSLRIVGKRIEECKIVLCGIGAAGMACTEMLISAGAVNVIGVDRQGALTRDESYANEAWNRFAAKTNPHGERGKLSDVIQGADVFIGVSGPGVLKKEDVSAMAQDPIIFAMANPTPEIDPDEIEGIARIIATGRSDYPNQINNVLCFPGLFRGVLDCRASKVTERMKLAAAHAIAEVVSPEELSELYIIPSVFNTQVVSKVRDAVVDAAYADGVARRRDYRDGTNKGV